MGTWPKAILAVLLLWMPYCLRHVEASSLKDDGLILPGIFRNVFARSQWTSQVRNAVMNLDDLHEKFTYWSEIGNNRSQCENSLAQFASDLNNGKPYTKKALDSTGKLQSGVLTGNYKWLGRYYECLAINEDGFQGRWCSIVSGHQSSVTGTIQGLTVGVCLPNTCTEDDVTDFLSFISNRSSTNNFLVDCPIQPRRWTASDLTFVIVLCALVILLIAGTLTEIHTKCIRRRDEILIKGSDANMELGVTSGNGNEPTGWRKTLLCFSIIKNTKALLNVERKDGTISCLHGLRFLSITWVVLGHSVYHLVAKVDNIVDMYEYMVRNVTSLVITNAFMAVDTFFFISGLLVAYLTLRDIDRLTAKRIPKLYLQRYIRLTPSYVFVILFLTGFVSKLGNGPFWPRAASTYRDTCGKYWWLNLLYISNLYPSSIFKECFVAGWYLDNDMQFFLLAPISLLVMKRNRIWGIAIIMFGIFSSILVTGIISSHYDLQPLTIMPSIAFKSINLTSVTNVNEQPPMNSKDAFWSDTYERPWCRISVYLIGMLTGFILVTTKSTMKISKIFILLGWAIAAAVNLSVVYGTWWYVQHSVPMETNLASFYNAMSRPAWACGLAWIVIACATGNGGPVDAFLSWKALVPLSRLTYCLYLVHEVILPIWLMSVEVDYHYATLEIPINYLGLLTLSCGVAYALSMLVETPFINLMKLLTGRHTPHQPIATPELPDSAILIVGNDNKQVDTLE